MQELLEHGFKPEELKDFTVNDGSATSTLLYPLAQNWPMGFAWSSFVAQEVLLRIAADGGLDSECVLAPDCPIPEDRDVAFAVATGNILICVFKIWAWHHKCSSRAL